MSEFISLLISDKKKVLFKSLCYQLACLLDLSSAVLAHFLLKERIQKMGIVGCVTCIVGSVVIVIHAPQEHTLNSVQEIWVLASQPGS